VKHPSIEREWKEIEEIHNQFHTYGHKVINSIKNSQKSEAWNYYAEAEKLSKKIFELLDQIEKEVDVQTEKGVQLFV
jgi:transaldolase